MCFTPKHRKHQDTNRKHLERNEGDCLPLVDFAHSVVFWTYFNRLFVQRVDSIWRQVGNGHELVTLQFTIKSPGASSILFWIPEWLKRAALIWLECRRLYDGSVLGCQMTVAAANVWRGKSGVRWSTGGRRFEQNGWERLRYFTTLRNPPLSLSLSAFYLFQSVSGSLSSSQGSQRMINQIAEDLYWFWRCFRQIAAWEAYVLLLSEARDVSPQGSSTEKLSQPSSLHEVDRFWGETEKWQQRFKEFTITRGPPCRTVGAH